MIGLISPMAMRWTVGKNARAHLGVSREFWKIREELIADWLKAKKKAAFPTSSTTKLGKQASIARTLFRCGEARNERWSYDCCVPDLF